MIELIHKYPILIKTLLAITTLAFVATGGFLYMGNDAAGGWVAKVDDQTVTDAEYQQLVSRYEEFYRDLYQGELPQAMVDNMDRMAIEELVDRRLMLLELDSMGIKVGDKQVSEAIVQTPTFHNEAGTFDKQRYLDLLRLNGMTPKSYEESIRRELSVNLFRDMVRESAEVSEDEARAYFAEQSAASGEAADEETFNERKDSIMNMLKSNKKDMVLASVLKDLRSKYTVEINPAYAAMVEPPRQAAPAQPPATEEGQPASPQAE